MPDVREPRFRVEGLGLVTAEELRDFADFAERMGHRLEPVPLATQGGDRR